MPVIVRPAGHKFKLRIKDGKEELMLELKQLTHQQKSHINSLTISVKNGEIQQDTSLTIFYNLKYAVKAVEGLVNMDGKPYELKFEEDGSLSDECTDELLSTPFSDSMQYSALALSQPSFPDDVLHPVTGKPLKGVSVIKDKAAGPRKKSTKPSK